MEQTQPTRPATERPGRWLATIVRVTTRKEGYIFARLIDSTEDCFIHRSTVPSYLWDHLKVGDAVTCKIQETDKGPRGHDIAAGSDADQSRVNRG